MDKKMFPARVACGDAACFDACVSAKTRKSKIWTLLSACQPAGRSISSSLINLFIGHLIKTSWGWLVKLFNFY